MATDIELLTTEDLLEEVARRFDSVCFVGYRAKYCEDQRDSVLYHHQGSEFVCLGLLEYMRDRLKQYVKEDYIFPEIYPGDEDAAQEDD